MRWNVVRHARSERGSTMEFRETVEADSLQEAVLHLEPMPGKLYSLHVDLETAQFED